MSDVDEIITTNMTKTGKAAGVGDQDILSTSGPFAGFKQAYEIVPGHTFSVTYINSWTDIGAAKEAAIAANAAGPDFIFPNADMASPGVFQAEKEKNFHTFGSTADQSSVAPDKIVANAVVNFPYAFLNLAQQIQDGTFEGNRIQSFGSKDPEGVYWVIKPSFKDKTPADVIAKVEDAQMKIVFGEIQVAGTSAR